jgi:hypothetical protein
MCHFHCKVIASTHRFNCYSTHHDCIAIVSCPTDYSYYIAMQISARGTTMDTGENGIRPTQRLFHCKMFSLWCTQYDPPK